MFSVILLLTVLIIQEKVEAGGCPFNPSDCNCPADTQYKRCAGSLCEKCICATGHDPGACLSGNGGGVYIMAAKLLASLWGKKK